MKFGASPDGVQDSSLAIQAAVHSAVSAGGGTIHFPCGDFRADSVLNGAPAQRSALYFTALANIAFLGEGKCSRIFTSAPARTVFEIQESKNVSFEKLRVEPAPAIFHEHYQNDGGSAIRLAGVDGGSIHDVEMSGGSAALLWINAGTQNYTVSHNYIHDGYGNSAIWEDDCSATDNAQNCAPSRPPLDNVIKGNLLVNNGTTGGVAQLVLDSGGHATNTRVIGNTVRGRLEPANPHIHGIQIENAGGALIEGNQLYDILDDGIAVTVNDSISIVNTRIVRNQIHGGCHDAGIIVYLDPEGNAAQTAIVGNQIDSIEGRGIVLHGTIASHLTGVEIADNHLRYAPSQGAEVDALVLRAHEVKLAGNVISSSSSTAKIVSVVDPDAAKITGLRSTRNADGAATVIVDPAHRSEDASP